MNKVTFKKHYQWEGMGYFVSKDFDPSKITDPFLRAVVTKARASYLEAGKCINEHLNIEGGEEE